MTLLKELIDIPEHIDKGQFVLRLTEGVTDAEATVNSYVVTEQLGRAFEDALNFIKGAMLEGTSKATYLHGSFGSGKSHFMAILHLILQGNHHARAIPELAKTIQDHNVWIEGKKFLLVPYHMIGSHNAESGILGGYVDYVRKMHPEAPIPGVYLAEELFDDADNLRQRMGDEAFFAALNEDGGGSSSGWGDLASAWDAERYEKAKRADPGSEERSQLTGVLIRKFFESYGVQMESQGEGYLSLDKGLSVISKHAAALGYDGLILFLDELILWLASRAADISFVHREGQKLAKLVEAQTADRAIPVISFIARQRDLRELIGESVPGADRLNFGDALKHWEGRFHKITLEDRNLPAIASKRILRCKNDSAREELDAAFAKTQASCKKIMDTLLTETGDPEMFRQVYPFSPALMQTLVAVSSVLQRERTALRVMMQLLVDQREHLQVGDLVPVGDLFDVIAHGDEAFSPDMAQHFDNAKRLYHQKLLPMLEKQFGPIEKVEALPVDDLTRRAFRDNDRLIKTLLLSALVPEVETLRGLTGERLATLNHGTIKVPVEGEESQEVLRRVREWASNVGEIRVGTESNPTITVHLSGVDTETIIQQATREDNKGNRVRRVRQMIFDQLGIEGEGEFEHFHEFTWKNTKRSCTVLFRNIRELSPTSFENVEESDWKLIIDFPFDDPGHGPKDDLSKLQEYREHHPQGAKTLCWVPHFFSDEANKELGKLVVLEHILTGERFSQYANHLSQQDRQTAKQLLENQRSILANRMQVHLDAAYGLEQIGNGSLDTTHELEPREQFVSLRNGFEPQPPVAATLQTAMQHLLYQALDHEFPGAPDFEADVKPSNLKKVHAVVADAIQSNDGRIPVDRSVRNLVRQIANPLKLGEMGHDATHFVLGQHWSSHLQKKAEETGSPMSVANLKDWIDQPRPMGLSKELSNLVILTFAEQTNHALYRHGSPFQDPTLTNVPNDGELVREALPDESVWNVAVARATTLFGEVVSPLLKPSNVSLLASKVKDKVNPARLDCESYRNALSQRLDNLSISADSTDRMKTATASVALAEQLQRLEKPDDIVAALASATIATTEAAMAECLSKAGALTATLNAIRWEMFDKVAELGGGFADQAKGILENVRQALASDEHVIPLAAGLQEAQGQAWRLIDSIVPATPPEPPAEVSLPSDRPVPTQAEVAGQKVKAGQVVSTDQRESLDVVAAEQLLGNLKSELKDGQEIELSIRWTIRKRGSA